MRVAQSPRCLSSPAASFRFTGLLWQHLKPIISKEYWEALHPYAAGGAYVNFLMDEGQERIRATYRENYNRLVMIKNKYDPTNLFRVNQNIIPTV